MDVRPRSCPTCHSIGPQMNGCGDLWHASVPANPDTYVTPSMDETWMSVAQVLAQRGQCTRRRVGAIILDHEHSWEIVGWGANGVPDKVASCLEGACPRGRMSFEQVPQYAPYDSGIGSCIAVHAEEMALLRSGSLARGCTMYVTEEPCVRCARLISAAYVQRVVTPSRSMVLRRASS